MADTSRRLAVAVAARDAGVGDQVEDDALVARLDARRWLPDYQQITATT